jgi:hypothetical protein
MKDSATDATESARFAVGYATGSEMTGARWKVRWRDCTEKPRVDVRGFGQGMRAVTAEIEPACSLIGRPIKMEFIA